MEQDEHVYEYEMHGEIYRFEALGEKEALDARPYVLLHFKDKLGSRFDEKELFGPRLVKIPEGPDRLEKEGYHLQPQAWGS